jgi:CRP-like cAMP-binding protein
MAESPPPLGLLVRKLSRHVVLPPSDCAALLALPHTLRMLDHSTYLLREGDPPQYCAVLTSGFAYRQKLTGEGARQIVSLHIPGEALDLQSLYLDVADHNIQTLTRAEVALVPRAAMRELIETRPAIAHAVMVEILVEASISREWTLNIGRRDAQTRLAHLLCEVAVRLDAQGLSGGEGYELPMTQEQLGDALGLTAVHVNRTLKALEGLGLIVRNRRHVGIPQWTGLRDVGDFTGRYLHFGPQTR